MPPATMISPSHNDDVFVPSAPAYALRSVPKPVKKLTFFRNGDRHFKGKRLLVDNRRFRQWESLLVELSRRVGPQAVTQVYDADTRRPVKSIEQLIDGRSYICTTGSDKLKDANYSVRRSRQWAVVNRVEKDTPTPLNVSPTMQRRKMPAVPNLTPAKVLTVYKNGKKLGRGSKYVLNRKTLQSFDQVLDAFSNLFFVSGGVRKVFSRDGRRLSSLEDLFLPSVVDVIVAGSHERFHGRRKKRIPSQQQSSRSFPGSVSLPPIATPDRKPPHDLTSMSAPAEDETRSRRQSTPHPGTSGSGRLTLPPIPAEPVEAEPVSSAQGTDGSSPMFEVTSEAVPVPADEGMTDSDNHVNNLVAQANAVESLQSREKIRQARGQMRRISMRQAKSPSSNTTGQHANMLWSQVEGEQAEFHRKLATEKERQDIVMASKMARRKPTGAPTKKPVPSISESDASPVRASTDTLRTSLPAALEDAPEAPKAQEHSPTKAEYTAIDHFAARMVQRWYRQAKVKAAQKQKSKALKKKAAKSKPKQTPKRSPVKAKAVKTPSTQPETPAEELEQKAPAMADVVVRASKEASLPMPLTKVGSRAQTPDLRVSMSMMEQARIAAAIKIQSKWRSFKQRKDFVSKKIAAKHIQKAYRHCKDRRANPGRRASKPVKPVGSPGTRQPRRASKPVVPKAPASRLSPHGIVQQSFIEARYKMHETLGDGNFAVVKRCVKVDSGEEFAVKIIDKKKLKNVKESGMVEKEVATMQLVDHPNCVKLFEVFETRTSIFLILELVRGGDLFDRIVEKGKYTEADASHLIKSLATAIKHLHSMNIVHRDLKPENCLVVQDAFGKDVVKLADFGLSLVVSDPLYTICGTPTYVAPEIISEDLPGYGIEVDMWAIGVIGYILLCGFPPFASSQKNQQDLFAKIKKGRYSFPNPYWQDVSDSAKNLISHLLLVDKSKRYTADDVLRHPFITENVASHDDRQENVTKELLKHFPNKKSKWRNAMQKLQAVRNFIPEEESV